MTATFSHYVGVLSPLYSIKNLRNFFTQIGACVNCVNKVLGEIFSCRHANVPPVLEVKIITRISNNERKNSDNDMRSS
jgi:hypothetical protein